jgi:hypothetical protein
VHRSDILAAFLRRLSANPGSLNLLEVYLALYRDDFTFRNHGIVTDRVKIEILQGVKGETNIVNTMKRGRLTEVITSSVGTTF